VQGGGASGKSFFGGASALVGIDGRPLLFSFALCGGAAAYFSLSFEPSQAFLWGLAAMTLVVWLAARRWCTSDVAIACAVVCLGLSAGTLAASLRASRVEAPVVEEQSRPAMLEGWVQDIEPGRKGVRLLIRVHSVAGMATDDWPRYVRLTHTSRLEVAPGRFVRCWAMLRPPPGPSMPGEYDFRRQAWFAELGAVGYVQGRCRGGALGAPNDPLGQATLWLGAARRNLGLHVHEAAGERAGGFAAALVSGDRSFMSTEDSEALRNAGLFHIVSISGLHLSIVGGIVFLLIKRCLVFIEPLALRVPVQKPAAIVATLACLAYMVISGAAVETQRSFVMIAVVFGAVIFDRAAISLRTFAIAMMVVVLLQPESVVTPGFQMSFAATGALVAAFEMWRDRRAGRDQILGPIGFGAASVAVTSLVAGLATMPFAVFHFDRAAPIGFAANLVATPIVSFLSAPAAIAAFVLAPFGQADLGLRLFGYSLELLLWVSHFFAQFAAETATPNRAMPTSALIAATLSLAGFMALRGRLRLVAVVALAGVSLALWGTAPRRIAHWSISGDFFYAPDASTILKLNLAHGDGLSPLRFSEASGFNCNKTGCELSAVAGTSIQITSGETPDVCVYARALEPPDAAHCADGTGNPSVHLRWPEVVAAGGRTVYLEGDRLFTIDAPACGKRPWYPCAKNSIHGPSRPAAPD
jgi:competence protein ComEC